MDVQLHKNGEYWLARWYDSSGRRKSKSLGHESLKSRTTALRECRELGAQMIVTPGKRDANKAPTLGTWREQYLKLRTDLDQATVYLHRRTTSLLIEHFSESMRLDKITRLDAASWRAYLEKLGTMGEASICMHIRNAKVIFGWAVDVDLLTANPFDRQRGTAPKVSHDWAQIGPAELEKILAECPNDAWRNLFRLARWAGLRRGEALRLEWGQIDWATHVASILPERRAGKRHETTKQAARVVPLAPALYDALRQTFENSPAGSRGPCDGTGCNNIDRGAHAIITRAIGQVYAKPFHTLRKNLETEWLSQYPIMDVVKWLGHSADVAAAHYHRPTVESVARVTGGTNQAQNVRATAEKT